MANAADVSSDPGVGGYGTSSVYGFRIEPVIVYDYEPGVIVRSYWEPPWRNHHYFRSTGRRPKVGRREHINARHASKSEDYFRYWLASSIFFLSCCAKVDNKFANDKVRAGREAALLYCYAP